MSTTVLDRQIETFTKAVINIPQELGVLEDGTEPQEGCSIFRVMTQKDGDKRVVWSRGSIPEINGARDMFNNLVAEGMVPHRVGTGGRMSSEVMSEFDASAEEVVFVPVGAIRGG